MSLIDLVKQNAIATAVAAAVAGAAVGGGTVYVVQAPLQGTAVSASAAGTVPARFFFTVDGKTLFCDMTLTPNWSCGARVVLPTIKADPYQGPVTTIHSISFTRAPHDPTRALISLDVIGTDMVPSWIQLTQGVTIRGHVIKANAK